MSKFTSERRATILEYIRHGTTITKACEAVGIARRSFYDWLEKNKGFNLDVRKAEADLMVKCIGVIENAATEGDWRAAAWYLERRFPRDWGNRIDPSNDDEGEIPLRDLTLEEVVNIINRAKVELDNAKAEKAA